MPCHHKLEAYLDALGDLLRDPAKFAVAIDRENNPDAVKILDEGMMF